MPQKKNKKAKPEKNKKPKPKTLSSALKTAAKGVAKKVGSALSSKPAKKGQKPKAPVKAAKAAKPQKKLPLKAADLKKKVPEKAPKPVVVKGKAATKVAAPALPAGKAQGKKKIEVVLEVPAPKGVALLGKEGKKKAKSEQSSKKRCREPGCDHDPALGVFCRLHYIKNWRKIKRKEAILASGQLNNYVEELVSKYPDKYLEVIRQDLASEKDWSKVVVDLELESSDEDGSGEEDLEGLAEGGARRERDFDDDSSDTF